jgi:hypothetical protein
MAWTLRKYPPVNVEIRDVVELRMYFDSRSGYRQFFDNNEQYEQYIAAACDGWRHLEAEDQKESK